MKSALLLMNSREGAGDCLGRAGTTVIIAGYGVQHRDQVVADLQLARRE